MSEQATTPLSIVHHFATLEDPRDHCARKHELTDILVIALCAMLGGGESWHDIEEFGNSKKEFFAQFLKLPNGIPSHDTFRRVFAALNPVAFQACFTAWINAVAAQLDFKHFAIDGKSSRGSADKTLGLGCLHTVTVWASEHGLCFAQQAVDKKSNEITAIPQVLQLLDLEGALVTIDAIGCQKKIATAVVEAKADFVLAVKENQPTLYHDIAATVDAAVANDFAEVKHAELITEDTGRGRKETRSYTVIYDPPGLSTKDEWPELTAVLAVTRLRVVEGKESEEMAYYIVSGTPTIEELAKAVRGHWGIENQQHWVLDVIFGEDRNTTHKGNAPENLAWLRRVALSLIRQDKSKGTIKGKRQRAGWNDDFLLHLLGILSAE
jgi:predicted transposase YbfD/YdcC